MLNINAVLDVGANNGQFGLMLRDIGYQGHIIAFEPIKSCYENIKNIHDDNWTVHNFALGGENKNIDINITKETTFTSFLRPNEYAKKIRSSEVPVVATETVPIKKLDDIFDTILSEIPSVNNDKLNFFLKMDTQGYDLEVFKGGKKIMANIIALQSEISILPLYEQMPTYIDSITAFREQGFELTGLYPVTRDPKTLFLVELDCIMRRI